MDLRDTRIVLVGGSGLVGSYVVEQLLHEPVSEIIVFDNFVRGRRENLSRAASDSRVRVLEGSMLDRSKVRAALEGADGVFLLASLWLGECVNDPRSAWEVNTLGTW